MADSPAASVGTSPGGAQFASPGASAPETALLAGFFPERRADSDSSSSGTSSYDQSGTDDEDEAGSELHKTCQSAFTVASTSRVNGQRKDMAVKAVSTGGSLLGVGAVDAHGKVRKASRQLSFAALDPLPFWPPIGSEWIEDGVCGLCEATLDATPWGRATCPGCSVVDVCRFQRHPFKPLLLDWHPDIPVSRVVPQADEPTPTYQAIAPTPPMGKRAGLRGVAVPKMFSLAAAFKQGDPQAMQKSMSMPRGNTSQPK